jgi:hypothetical protein
VTPQAVPSKAMNAGSEQPKEMGPAKRFSIEMFGDTVK